MTCIEQPTKEQWALIEERLNRQFARVELEVDGYKLTLTTCLVKRQLWILPYVNGEFKGIWMTQGTEEARRFMRLRSRAMYSPKRKRALEKAVGKKHAREMGSEKKLESYTWEWPSFGPLKRHLIKNSERIKLVDLGYQF